jgi:hypothetical protein
LVVEDTTKTVEIPISAEETIRVEGLQRDRRRRSDVRITLPDGRVLLAHGRHPVEDGWEVYFEDGSDVIGGLPLGASVARLMGWAYADAAPVWLDRFDDEVS